MPFANSSEARIARIAEATYGVIPATPAFQVGRFTGGGMRTTKSTATSNELRADRNVPDEIMVGQDVAGSYPFELSYGSFDDLLEAALFGAWTTNVLKNGVARKSFTFEETVELGATDAFSRYTGCMVNSLALAIERRAIITGSFGLMGQKEALAVAIVTGATYVAANSKPVINSTSHVTALTIPNMPAPKVSRLSFEVNNGLRTRPVVSALFSEEFGWGRCEVTGTFDAYFESNVLLQAILDHGFGALSTTIGAATGEKYTILLPKVIFGDGARQIGGNNDDVMVSVPFRAVFDATEACSIKITRAVT